MTTSQVTCPCGALYERTEFNAAPRVTDGFVCSICGTTLEVFTNAKAPTYRLVSGPVRQPSSE
jgi:transcription initiation factor IIE alpha subunit